MVPRGFSTIEISSVFVSVPMSIRSPGQQPRGPQGWPASLDCEQSCSRRRASAPGLRSSWKVRNDASIGPVSLVFKARLPDVARRRARKIWKYARRSCRSTGRRSSISAVSRSRPSSPATGSIPAPSARWASDCRSPSAPRPPSLRHRSSAYMAMASLWSSTPRCATSCLSSASSASTAAGPPTPDAISRPRPRLQAL